MVANFVDAWTRRLLSLVADTGQMNDWSAGRASGLVGRAYWSLVIGQYVVSCRGQSVSAVELWRCVNPRRFERRPMSRHKLSDLRPLPPRPPDNQIFHIGRRPASMLGRPGDYQCGVDI